MTTEFIGVMSDTHGLVREEALAALAGARAIIHAGDVGAAEVIEALGEIAPVVAIRGNCDVGEWARRLPETEVADVFGKTAYIVHSVADLEIDPRDGFDAVISGHSHKPGSDVRDGVLYLNPGSAGPRRFSLPVTVARLRIEHGILRAEIVELQV